MKNKNDKYVLKLLIWDISIHLEGVRFIRLTCLDALESYICATQEVKTYLENMDRKERLPKTDLQRWKGILEC